MGVAVAATTSPVRLISNVPVTPAWAKSPLIVSPLMTPSNSAPAEPIAKWMASPSSRTSSSGRSAAPCCGMSIVAAGAPVDESNLTMMPSCCPAMSMAPSHWPSSGVASAGRAGALVSVGATVGVGASVGGKDVAVSGSGRSVAGRVVSG